MSDLARSEAFYRRVLGLGSTPVSGNAVALTAPGGAEPLIELIEKVGVRPVPRGGRIGLYHFAILLPSRPALADFARHATGLGLRLAMSDHLVSEAIYLSDPDGLGIEVYHDRPRDQWRWRGDELVMATEPLAPPDLLDAASARDFHGVPAATRIGHVHLHVRDLDAGARFYQVGLGFDRMVWSYPGALFLSAGGYHHHLGLNTWAREAPLAGPDDARLLEWSVVLPRAIDVAAVADRLRMEGLDLTAAPDRLVAHDPWGTTVQVRTGD